MLDVAMIAPCGMNCALCVAYQRTKNNCAGCHRGDESKPAHCVKCTIKHCMHRDKHTYCYSCEKYPCRRLRQLDERYQKNYHMSMLENLGQIRDNGLSSFLASEETRWTCNSCGALLCVHKKLCDHCKAPR